MIRGNEAAQVLRHPRYVEAYTVIRERIVSQLAQAELAADKRDRLNNLLIALSSVQKYMEQVAMGGKMAAQQIERDRTLAQRMGDKLRSVA